MPDLSRPLTRRGALVGAAGLCGAGLLTNPAWGVPRTALPASPPATPERVTPSTRDSGLPAPLAPEARGGRRWRLAYAETMAYANYTATLAAMVQGLSRLGWLGDVSAMPFAPGDADSASLWSWLSRSAVDSSYLEFVADAFVTGLDRNPADALIERLRDSGDIDLLIVMGTVAGVKLATDAHPVPTLVFSATNPLSAGIVTSETDTGHDHIWAHLDPRRFNRQLAVFHRTFRFRRLGIAYEDSAVGRAIASLSDIEAAAEQMGFTLVRQDVRTPIGPYDQPRYERDLSAAWDALSRTADAAYITYGRWTPDRFSTLIQPFLDRHIPTFSQLGPEEVERGALMSIARANMAGIGQFGAMTIARALNGAPPRHLPQVYFDTPSIAWNLSTAAAVGYRIPFSALVAADAIYGVSRS